jgi:hypothetical protein
MNQECRLWVHSFLELWFYVDRLLFSFSFWMTVLLPFERVIGLTPALCIMYTTQNFACIIVYGFHFQFFVWICFGYVCLGQSAPKLLLMCLAPSRQSGLKSAIQCFAIKTAVAFFERAAKSTVLAGIRSICHQTICHALSQAAIALYSTWQP